MTPALYPLFLTRDQVRAISMALESALEDRALPMSSRTAIAAALASLSAIRLSDPPLLRSGSKGFA